jgi:HK97 family phage major capsid protein
VFIAHTPLRARKWCSQFAALCWESEAFRVADRIRMQQRARSTTDDAGGYLVPMSLDVAVILTSSGSTNPMRQIARNVTIATDSWNGVSSAGVTAEWIAEASEVADASPSRLLI